MRLWTCLLCVIPLWVVGCGNSDSGGPPPTTPDSGTADNTSPDSGFAQAMLTTHNSLRANATPAPNPALPPLAWSVEMAKKAQAWADQCKLANSPDAVGFGQNLAGSSANHVKTAQVAQIWGSEAAGYNYAQNTCAPGKACGEYTQVVWRDTTQLGCAVKVCTENSPIPGLSTWEVWVCFYSPAGNVEGQRPY